MSTATQLSEGISISAQQSSIERYCEANGLRLANVFRDAGISGRRASNRPGLESAIHAACGGRGVLIVYSLSRLARSLKDTITISERLDRSGAQLVLLAERIDTTTAAGRFFFTMTAALGQMEAELIGERTKSALAHKREQGERWCQSAPYGFRWCRGRVEPEPSEQAVLRQIERLHERGMTVRHIAEELARRGVRNRGGNPLPFQQVHRLLQRAG